MIRPDLTPEEARQALESLDGIIAFEGDPNFTLMPIYNALYLRAYTFNPTKAREVLVASFSPYEEKALFGEGTSRIG